MKTMNRGFAAMIVVPMVFGGLAACAQPEPPKTLLDARADFARSRDGVAGKFDPTDVHEAEFALSRAEQAWRDAPDDPSTGDLVLIADRKALIAESTGDALAQAQSAGQSKEQLDATHAAQLKSANGQLAQSQQQLGATQVQLQSTQAAAAAQAQKLAALEASLADARNTIARIAAVKDDARGMVITLQGEVLFKTGKFDLKAGAMAKLDEIANALKGKEQPIVVFGYTDNVGTAENNQTLSQNRAQTVRDYLVSKGLPADLVTAQGKGMNDPVSDNNGVEGRAQNRRVEIVVQPKP